MSELLNILILFILGILAVTLAGLVAGFSPTLYIAQATLFSKTKAMQRLTLALMAGVITATIILLVLFQTFSLTSLLNTIDSAAHALFVSVVFNIIVGLLFILAGYRYVRTKDTLKAYDAGASEKEVKKYSGIGALFSLGFIKTLLSISGVTAIFIGGNIIANTTTLLFERTMYTLLFLAATVAPFLAVYYFLQRQPGQLQSIINRTKARLSQLNYRSTVGFAAIIFGSSIVVFNIMMALFY